MTGIRAVAYEAPTWGTGVLLFRGDVLLDHEAPRRRAPSAPVHPPAPGREAELCDRLTAYLRGARVAFDDVDLDAALDLLGATPFTRDVLHAVRAVPYGTTASYRDLAEAVGRPRAWRAAGTACAQGPLPVIVPYHRIIASSGAIGRYGPDGTGAKRRLLALEGVYLAGRPGDGEGDDGGAGGAHGAG